VLNSRFVNASTASEGRSHVPLESLPTMITVRQTMDILGISRATIYNLIKRGAFRVVKVGDATRFRLTEVLEYIEERTIPRVGAA